MYRQVVRARSPIEHPDSHTAHYLFNKTPLEGLMRTLLHISNVRCHIDSLVEQRKINRVYGTLSRRQKYGFAPLSDFLRQVLGFVHPCQ